MTKRPDKPKDRESSPRFKEGKEKRAQKEADIGKITAPALKAMRDGIPFVKAGLDDAALARVTGSFLEDMLKIAMLVRFRRLPTADEERQVFRSNGGALSTFSNRINMCAVMGLLVGDMRHDIDQIRWIRNEFAHSYLTRSFDEPDIAAACAKLRLNAGLSDPIKAIFPEGPRRTFVVSAVTFFGLLNQGILIAMVEASALHENDAYLKGEARKIWEEWHPKTL